MLQIQLNTACEGPLALNDNASELCREFLKPHGDRFFIQVSRYGDYLADIAKKPEYQAGDTLKLILPFLKAHGLTNAMIRDSATQNLRLLSGAEETYKFLHGFGFPIFALSIGYRQFAEAVGSKLGFDSEHLVCTELDLDRYRLAASEAEELRRLEEEIAAAPAIELPPESALWRLCPDRCRRLSPGWTASSGSVCRSWRSGCSTGRLFRWAAPKRPRP